MALSANFDDRPGRQAPGVKNSAANFGRGFMRASRTDVGCAWAMTALALDSGDRFREIGPAVPSLHVRCVAVETTKGELGRLHFTDRRFSRSRSFGRLPGRQTRAAQFRIVRKAVFEIPPSNAANQRVADGSRSKRPLNIRAGRLASTLRREQQSVGGRLITVADLAVSLSNGFFEQDRGEWTLEHRPERLPVMALGLSRIDIGVTFRARRSPERCRAAQETEYQPHYMPSYSTANGVCSPANIEGL